MRVRDPPSPACAAELPMQAPGELRSNLTKLAAGCAGLYLGVGWGSRVPGPQLPGAPGCTTASAHSPFSRSCPASREGEEPRPRPVQPRLSRAAPGSPPLGLGR